MAPSAPPGSATETLHQMKLSIIQFSRSVTLMSDLVIHLTARGRESHNFSFDEIPVEIPFEYFNG